MLGNSVIHVSQWIKVNKLKVNTSEFKFISFSYITNLSLPPINIDSGYTYETDNIKFLGFLIDKDLTLNVISIQST